ncbi:MAG: chromate transporter [Alphaproteobacteria bacterium]
MDNLLRLAVLFGTLSLLSIGGGNVTIAEMHHQSVSVYDWLSDRQFADLFALSQAAPGPGTLIVVLIGWKAAGWLGAAVAGVSMFGPSSVLMYVSIRLWDRFRDSPWRTAIEHGLAPIALGLIFAAGYAVTEAADHGPKAYAISAVTTGIFLWTRINPLIVMAAVGALSLWLF